MKIDDLRNSWSAEIYLSDSDVYNSYYIPCCFVFDTKPPTTRWHSNSVYGSMQNTWRVQWGTYKADKAS